VTQLDKGQPCVTLEYVSRSDIRILMQNISWLVEGMKLDTKLNRLNVYHHNTGAVEIWTESELIKTCQPQQATTPLNLN
jgi:hypothetical protein